MLVNADSTVYPTGPYSPAELVTTLDDYSAEHRRRIGQYAEEWPVLLAHKPATLFEISVEYI